MEAEAGAGKSASEFQATSRIRAAIGFAIIFVAVIIALHVYGKSSRVYSPGSSSITVESPEEAFAIWNARKVKGRALLLFGKYPHIKKPSDYEGVRELDASNFIEFAAFNNIVRRVYYIIPDDRWEEVIRGGAFGSMRRAPGMERGLYLFNLIGIPIIATTPSSLPRLSETSLVYINTMEFDEQAVQDYLSKKGMSSDIAISYNGG